MLAFGIGLIVFALLFFVIGAINFFKDDDNAGFIMFFLTFVLSVIGVAIIDQEIHPEEEKVIHPEGEKVIYDVKEYRIVENVKMVNSVPIDTTYTIVYKK